MGGHRTELPIRIEIEGKAEGKATRWQMDFRWGEAVSPSVFEPNVPSDYTRIRTIVRTFLWPGSLCPAIAYYFGPGGAEETVADSSPRNGSAEG